MFDHEEPIEYGMTLGELLKRRKRAEAREKLIAQSEGVVAVLLLMGICAYGMWKFYKIIAMQLTMFAYQV